MPPPGQVPQVGGPALHRHPAGSRGCGGIIL